jgi:ribonuclease P protein component
MPEKKPVSKISSFTRTEITQLFKKARISVRCTGLRILAAPTNNTCGRILIVTPKASGNAPKRNLFRRRIRAFFREHNLGQYSKDFVVIVNKRGIDLPFSKLGQLLLCAAKGNNV